MGDAEVHQVVNVLCLQHGQVHLHARQVAILALAQLHAVHDRGDHVVRAHGIHLQRQGAVSAKDGVSGLHGLAQHGVGHREASVVSLETVVNHELQLLALRQVDLVTDVFPEESRADLGPLGVQQDAHGLVGACLRGKPDPLHGVAVHLMVAVGEVQAANVQAAIDELHQLVFIPARRAHGADDLALAVEAVGLVVEGRQLGHVVRDGHLALAVDCARHAGLMQSEE
mmetsp:Transcript_77390/g.217193  ORF Transcript_77390/g.217193 Transcript_77390/m.217193 type:complete len:227 (-) Transcript_77390:45-725(-)